MMLALGGGALRADIVLLRNGFQLEAERVERLADVVRVHTATGVIELAATQIESVEMTPPRPVKPVSKPEKPAAEPAAPPLSTREMVTQAAIRAGLPPEFVHSVARAESNYQTQAVSPKGAIGVMQLMPGTAAALNANPHDPEENIEAGTRYLRELLLKYNGDAAKALAAYNAGPGAVDRYQGIPPYRETVLYVDKVLRDYQKRSGNGRTPTGTGATQ